MATPVKIQKLFELTTLGVNPQSVSFANLTMESDKFICVRENIDEQKSIAIIDVASQTLSRNKINAESAIMNPSTRVLALRAGNTLQIFNLEMRSKMKEHNMTEPVLFWKWISVNTIALVTAAAVFHWSMEGSSQPRKVFDRHVNLAAAQIINYRVDESEKWCLLIGLAKVGESMKGLMQLYSVDKQVSQPIEGHSGTFVKFKISPDYTSTLISIAANTDQGGKLFVMEVPANDKPATAPAFQKRAVQVNFSSALDFPVAMQASSKHGILYMITRAGYLFLFDVETGTQLYTSQISNDAVFVTAVHEPTNGIIGVNRQGSVMTMFVDEATIVPYITNTLGNVALGVRVAARANLPGAEELFINQFNNLLNEMNIEGAVRLAAESPNNILRTPQTIQRLQRIPPLPNQKPALSVYFQYLLDKGKLNAYESLELSRIVLQKPGGAQYIKKLIDEDKMEGSEDLGDLVSRYDPDLSMAIYLKGGAHRKIIDSLIARGDYTRVLAYCQKVEIKPDYLDILKKLVTVNPDSAVNYAIAVNDPAAPKLDPNVVVDIFVQAALVKQVTAYLLEYLKEDKPEHAALQTRLLEINFAYSPVHIPDSILGTYKYHHYDKEKIARLCEKAGLFQRALENYSETNDRRRVIVNTQFMNIDWLINFFGNFSVEESLLCLRDLMQHNKAQNVNVVVKIAKKYSDIFSAEALIKIFEDFKSFDGLFYYLQSIIGFSQDPDVHFKYIEAATRIGNYQEVERITRESNYYEPEKTKEFLKEVKLPDQWPLINVCDKYDYIEELVKYLYSNNMLKYIDAYAQKRNPLKTPQVVGALLDVDCNEDFIKNMILAVGNSCPVEQLVEEVEKRNRLKLILPWLEARVQEGNTEPATHNAIGKIYIDVNNNPEQFLKTNQYYDSKVVGKYCEKRGDPNLAFVAYQRGQCDIELVAVTSKNGMFKQQAKYLVERQDQELWVHVLSDENQFRRQLVDQVVQTALPNSKSPEEVSSTVKAFMVADLPNELIELLEKIVLHGSSDFRSYKSLQNLLILTAIKADKTKVMDYINRLDNYDAPDIANICVSEKLFEEAFVIYKKFNFATSAVRVLLDNIGSLDRAHEYAERVQDPDVFSILGTAQLHANMIPEAVESFLKANDPSSYMEVIAAAGRTGHYPELIKYLTMARKKVKESRIDSELVYSYAKTAKLAGLEEFISSPNVAQLQNVGDRCFDEELYEAARILFSSINNYGCLASTLVRLNQFQAAVEAARKANKMRTWKEVNHACVDAKEFTLAKICGLNIIISAEELEELIQFYEIRGYFEELMALVEAGLGHERSHTGMFTELGILYAKYKPTKLMEHIQLFWKRLNIPKLLQACQENQHWAEMRFLYSHYDEYDNAAKIMMDHSPEAWEHGVFKDTITKVLNMELYYKAILFYLQEQPTLINDLLGVLKLKVDHERVVREVRKAGHLPLVKPYLQDVQDANLRGVNEAVNGLYIEEEDYEALRNSTVKHDNFDQIGLAQQLEKHELLEFRRIATLLYKRNSRWMQSVELSKKDKLYKDAMETTAESANAELAESLLNFFVENGLKECFSAALYTCYDLVRPDVALELAWRFKIIDFAFPYFINVVREYVTKVDNIIKDTEEAKAKAKSAEAEQNANMIASSPATGYFPGQPPMMVDPHTGAPMVMSGYADVNYADPNAYNQNAFL